MIVDSSALVSILLREPGHQSLLDHFGAHETVKIGAPTLVETGMVLVGRIGVPGTSLLARFVTEADIQTVEVGPTHWPVAVSAFVKYGKGRHPAGLNFGDCLTYAVAVLSHEPLLCIGDDFSQTDLQLVK